MISTFSRWLPYVNFHNSVTHQLILIIDVSTIWLGDAESISGWKYSQIITKETKAKIAQFLINWIVFLYSRLEMVITYNVLFCYIFL